MSCSRRSGSSRCGYCCCCSCCGSRCCCCCRCCTCCCSGHSVDVVALLVVVVVVLVDIVVCVVVVLDAVAPLSSRSINQSTLLSVCLSLCTQKKLVCETIQVFALNKIKNETSLRDCLHVCRWWHQKTDSFCETSSTFEVDSIENETTLRYFQSCMQSRRPHTNAFTDFFAPHVEITTPAAKKRCRVIRSAVPVAHKYLNKPKPANLLFQNATLSGNQRPDLRTALVLFFDPAFPSVHIVGRLTSKLLSNQFLYIYMTYGCM